MNQKRNVNTISLRSLHHATSGTYLPGKKYQTYTQVLKKFWQCFSFIQLQCSVFRHNVLRHCYHNKGLHQH